MTAFDWSWDDLFGDDPFADATEEPGRPFDTTWEGLSPPYATIVVDPPWHYDKPIPKARQNRTDNYIPYPTLALDEIKALPVGDLTTDGRCYLWVTDRYLRYGWDVLEAWGFTTQARTLVWCKPRQATMWITTEFVLMGSKGHPPRQPWHGTTWFEWPRGRGHSTKPAAFGDLVESWSPGPYVELFARAPRLGWDSWGKGYEVVAS
jgi:N6-adenosine-specific RNA methylase IME4